MLPKTTTTPYPLPLPLGPLGSIRGISIPSAFTKKPLCHYFGGVPYALPPTGEQRFRRPRPLPGGFVYGTEEAPGVYEGQTNVCPQPDSGADVDADAAGEGRRESEDCLQVNVWVPAGEVCEGGITLINSFLGWPVYFWIPSSSKAAYRLNLLGFLASSELLSDSSDGSVGNLGFWDQRLALEWTAKKASYFGGNAGDLTVGGYSAGSHSAFHQLAYDLFLPDKQSLIKRCVMHSKSAGVQPHTLSERQAQFDELLSALSIPLSLSPSSKLSKLRSLSPKALVHASQKMTLHQFRATSGGAFIRRDLFALIQNGDFAAEMRRRNITLLTGECRDEHSLYGIWYPPLLSYLSLQTRLLADYPPSVCLAILSFYSPTQQLPRGCKDWRDAFGRIYADVQIHATERGFLSRLASVQDLVYRYRVCWRAECIDGVFPPEWGVTHSSDMPIWFWAGGEGDYLREGERRFVRRAFVDAHAVFLGGGDVRGVWGTQGMREVRRLRGDGEVDVWRDGLWDKGVELWEIDCLKPLLHPITSIARDLAKTRPAPAEKGISHLQSCIQNRCPSARHHLRLHNRSLKSYKLTVSRIFLSRSTP
ncbi:alpha/beta-hydrolase [Aulographum hederae CBS 113979]|uniref:Carboxylic ester hydrolase n=1 Tax=Aulographum hederae CBS 113979 TaxID=1176131 RepID=A0A6G1HAI6_9PEZI|nr:alpha/beta-hydrolase [Aulographum hederae CBS 113979]